MTSFFNPPYKREKDGSVSFSSDINVTGTLNCQNVTAKNIAQMNMKLNTTSSSVKEIQSTLVEVSNEFDALQTVVENAGIVDVGDLTTQVDTLQTDFDDFKTNTNGSITDIESDVQTNSTDITSLKSGKFTSLSGTNNYVLTLVDDVTKETAWLPPSVGTLVTYVAISAGSSLGSSTVISNQYNRLKITAAAADYYVTLPSSVSSGHELLIYNASTNPAYYINVKAPSLQTLNVGLTNSLTSFVFYPTEQYRCIYIGGNVWTVEPITILNPAIDTIEGELVTINSDIADLTSTTSSHTSSISTLSSTVSSHTSSINTLNTSFSTINNDVSDLQDAQTTIEGSISTLQQDTNTLTTQLTTTNNDLDTLQTQVTNIINNGGGGGTSRPVWENISSLAYLESNKNYCVNSDATLFLPYSDDEVPPEQSDTICIYCNTSEVNIISLDNIRKGSQNNKVIYNDAYGDYIQLFWNVDYDAWIAVLMNNQANWSLDSLPTPDDVTDVVATPQDGQISVTWTPGANNNDFSTTYTAFTLDGESNMTSHSENSPPILLTELVNGVSYSVFVYATFLGVNSGNVSAGDPVVPNILPDAPTNVSAEQRVATDRAYINFDAPVISGYTVLGYRAESTPGGFVGSVSGDTASEITVTGLTVGVGYTFTVTAYNNLGYGTSSDASSTLTIADVPDAPLNVASTNVFGGSKISVTFDSSANNGSAITQYTAISTPGSFTKSCAGTLNEIIFGSTDGLSYATDYTFVVFATNIRGDSSNSSATDPGLSITFIQNEIVYALAYQGITPYNNTEENVETTIDTSTNSIIPNWGVLSIDKSILYVTNSNGNQILAIDTTSNSIIQTKNIGCTSNGIAVSPDGNYVYIVGTNSTLMKMESDTYDIVDTLAISDASNNIAINPAGTKAYIGASNGSTINLVSVVDLTADWSTYTPTTINFPANYFSNNIRMTPDGSKLFVMLFFESSLGVINCSTDSIVQTIGVPGGGPLNVVFTSDSATGYVAMNSANTVVKFDVATGDISTDPTITVNNPWGLRVSDDDAYLFAAAHGESKVSKIDLSDHSEVAYFNTNSDLRNLV
jgi:DNA-binding beta-propeller fold protein YncE/predicted  nucleic acid-binding Zn-ribbon protein